MPPKQIETVQVCALCTAPNGDESSRTSAATGSSSPSDEHLNVTVPEPDELSERLQAVALGSTSSGEASSQNIYDILRPSTPQPSYASMPDCPVEVLNMIYLELLKADNSSDCHLLSTAQPGSIYPDLSLRRCFQALQPLRSVHSWVADSVLGFWLDLVRAHTSSNSQYRHLSFELSVESLKRTEAVLRSSKVASMFDSVTLVEFLPRYEITNEGKYCSNLRSKLDGRRFRRFDTEEQDDILRTHWFESQEHFFEVKHILEHGHLAYAMRNLHHAVNLSSFGYSCFRFGTRSMWLGSSRSPPEQSLTRPRISVAMQRRQAEYPGLQSFLTVAQLPGQLHSVKLKGVDGKIGAMSLSARNKLSLMIGQAQSFELEESSDWKPKSTDLSHTSILRKAQAIVTAAANVQHLNISFDTNRLEKPSNVRTYASAMTHEGSQTLLMPALIKNTHFHCLQKVALQNHQISVDELRAFLQRHSESLRQVRFFGVRPVRASASTLGYSDRKAVRDMWTSLEADLESMPNLADAEVGWHEEDYNGNVYSVKVFSRGDEDKLDPAKQHDSSKNLSHSHMRRGAKLDPWSSTILMDETV